MKRILLAAIAIAGFSVPYTASALTVDMISVTVRDLLVQIGQSKLAGL